VDFFTVPTVLFKVLFVFVVLAHHRRRVVHVNVTDAPTAQWTAQQLVEAFPWDTAPRDLLRDRDGLNGGVFSRRVHSLGIREVKTAPRSPWQNPYVDASLEPTAASASTIWSCSTRPTCVGCCETTLPTTTASGRTSPWTRTPRNRERYTVPTWAESLRRPLSAASIIATAGWRRRSRLPLGVPGALTLAVSGFAWRCLLFLHTGREIRTDHVGPRWGVLRSRGPGPQTNGHRWSFEHLDGLSGRDRERWVLIPRKRPMRMRVMMPAIIDQAGRKSTLTRRTE
jgi:hypothetical protein